MLCALTGFILIDQHKALAVVPIAPVVSVLSVERVDKGDVAVEVQRPIAIKRFARVADTERRTELAGCRWLGFVAALDNWVHNNVAYSVIPKALVFRSLDELVANLTHDGGGFAKIFYGKFDGGFSGDRAVVHAWAVRPQNRCAKRFFECAVLYDDEEMSPFGIHERFSLKHRSPSVLESGVSRAAGGLIGAKQEYPLSKRNNRQHSREPSEQFGITSDRLSRSILYAFVLGVVCALSAYVLFAAVFRLKP